MIRINLLRRRTPSYAGGKQAGPSRGFGGMFKSGTGGFKKILVPVATVFGIPLALGYGASLAFDHYAALRKDEMQAEETALASDKTKVNQEISKVSGFERKRDEIDANLRSIRGKMDAIEKLLQNRDAPTKALIHLSQAIPSSAWISTLNLTENSFELKGGAMDPALVTDFIANLQKSVYFKEVQLRDTTSVEQSSDKVSFGLSGSR
jgi:Tfp pilus assembly protein PilN